MTSIEILDGPVSKTEVVGSLQNPAHGGQAFFFGLVRNLNHGRTVLGVSYECHRTLATREISRIIADAGQKWGEGLDFVVHHGTNRLAVGEVSVGIGVSSKHRTEAFEACRYVIEQLKVRVPIWKQEHYSDGDSEWLKGHELCQHEIHP